MAATSEREATRPAAARGRGTQALYASGKLKAVAENATLVSVNVSIPGTSTDLDPLREAAIAALWPPGRTVGKATPSNAVASALREALKGAAVDIFNRVFAAEIKKVVDAYRLMLRESLAKGEDPELQAALNRARLQERILAGTPMVDQSQACQLLGLSDTNASATMKRKEDRQEILRFTVDGRAIYPLFQFDVEGRRLFPAMARLIAMKPRGWSDFRLLHWLTRPHLDMDGTPAEALGPDEEAVIAAFGREIEPAVHG